MMIILNETVCTTKTRGRSVWYEISKNKDNENDIFRAKINSTTVFEVEQKLNVMMTSFLSVVILCKD